MTSCSIIYITTFMDIATGIQAILFYLRNLRSCTVALLMGVFMNCTVEMGLDIKFHEDWLWHSNVNRRGGYAYTHRKVISYTYFIFSK
jgi:hypothetical protein